MDLQIVREPGPAHIINQWYHVTRIRSEEAPTRKNKSPKGARQYDKYEGIGSFPTIKRLRVQPVSTTCCSASIAAPTSTEGYENTDCCVSQRSLRRQADGANGTQTGRRRTTLLVVLVLWSWPVVYNGGVVGDHRAGLPLFGVPSAVYNCINIHY